jgi:hypothetical protein
MHRRLKGGPFHFRHILALITSEAENSMLEKRKKVSGYGDTIYESPSCKNMI